MTAFLRSYVTLYGAIYKDYKAICPKLKKIVEQNSFPPPPLSILHLFVLEFSRILQMHYILIITIDWNLQRIILEFKATFFLLINVGAIIFNPWCCRCVDNGPARTPRTRWYSRTTGPTGDQG